MKQFPFILQAVFFLTTLVSVFFFYKAARNSKIIPGILIFWITLQGLLSATGFYTFTNTIPPRFVLLILPPLLLIMLLFFTRRGRQFIDSLDLRLLTLLHVVRIPVEIVLFWLFVNKAVPVEMTFEGRNPDILSGLTAPFIYYVGFVKKRINEKMLLVWNIICLLLLLNIVAIAILSAPFPFQQLAFDQPNIAVLYFPFTWLPCCVVPLVLLAHLASIRHLLIGIRKNKLVSAEI